MSHNFNIINNTEPSATGNFTINTNQFFLAGRGLSSSYPSGSITTNTRLQFYDTAPLNNISGLTVTSTANWLQYVTLPAGKYRCTAFWSGIFSASGSLDFSFRLGGVWVGNTAVIGASINATLDGSSLASAYINISSSTTLEVACVGQTNLSANASQGNVPAEESFFFVERLE